MVEDKTKEDERWASRGLVAMLIREMKNYSAAAEIESGSVDVFAMCEREVEEKIAKVQDGPSAVSGLELQKVLDSARAEVEEHERWQNQVFKSFPKEDDEQGLTGPLRQSFTQSAKARESLLSLVDAACAKYFTK